MSISWTLKRLRAMGIAEIVHRLRSWLAQWVESARISRSWQPNPGFAVGHGTALFPEIDGWRDAWHRHFELGDEKLDALVDGKIDLFSYQSLDVGQPVDWHRDPLTGQVSPLVYGKTLNYRDSSQVGDIKVLWELGRHQHLVALATGWVVCGKPEYRDSVTEQIEQWVEANPFGLGVHWCSSLEVGLRLISWALVHNLLILGGDSRGLFSAVRDSERLGTAIYQQARFIRHHLSLHSSANNHLIGELTGLWVATQSFDLGLPGKKWGDFAQRELENQARLQTHPDGVNKEQAIYYHLEVLDYLLFTWLVGERVQRPYSQEFRDLILRMSEFLRDVSLEERGPPQIGDADDGFVTRFEPGWPEQPYAAVQDAVAAVFQGGKLPYSRKRSQKAFWYALVLEKLPDLPSPADRSCQRTYPVLYKQGGYAILGDDRFHLVFDAGPLGYPSIAAHGHADALSFCLALDGEWWIVDPGTYAYHRETEWRDYFRSTAAHNTLVLNEQNQSAIGGPFLWLQKAHGKFEDFGKTIDGNQYVTGAHDGYREMGATHRRSINYDTAARTWEILDQIDYQRAATINRASVFFHFAPGVTLDIENQICRASRTDLAAGLQMTLDPDCHWAIFTGSINPVRGWYSPSLGQKVPAPVLVGTHKNSAPTNISTNIKICDPSDRLRT